MHMQVSGTDLRVLSAKLRAAGASRQVRRKLSRGLRSAASPLVPAVRASIAAIPAHGPDHSGLRKRMQKATRLKVRTTGREAQVTILVDPKRMPDGQKALPQYMEGVEGHTRWRHPVWGHDRWVTQESHPYFFPVVRPAGAAARAEVSKVVAEITHEIT
jgi:hypothetical protein